MVVFRNEKYFAAGLAGAVLALYAVSTFSYFSSGDGISPASARTSPEPVVKSRVVNQDSRIAYLPNENNLKTIIENVKSNESRTTDVLIPGVSCKITEGNLSHDLRFQSLSDGCLQITGD